MHRRPAMQAKAALKGLLQPAGLALQRLTGMHKSKVTGHTAYLSASTAPGTGGDVEVLWYSSQARAVNSHSPASRLLGLHAFLFFLEPCAIFVRPICTLDAFAT